MALIIKVVEKGSNNPLRYVQVQAGSFFTNTDTNGVANFAVPSGEYVVKVRDSNYRPFSQRLTAPGTYSVELEFARY